MAGYALSPRIRIHWIEGGDHSMKKEAHIEEAVVTVADFVAGLR